MLQPLMTKSHSGQMQPTRRLYCQLAGMCPRSLTQYQWDKIVALQVDTAPWTDVRGKEQPKARVKSYLSFMDCVTLHLQTVFAKDAAEQEWYYISNILKKSQRVFLSVVQGVRWTSHDTQYQGLS